MDLIRLLYFLVFISSTLTRVTFADDWSWGADDDNATLISSVENTSDLSSRTSANISDAKPRFLGLSQKLCSLGIGTNCDTKPYPPAIDSHYGPPAAASLPSTSSYATLSYDNINGPSYPAAVSPAKVSSFEPNPFFVAPEPYPSQTNFKPSLPTSNSNYSPPKGYPSHETQKPAYTGLHEQTQTATNIVQHIHSHTHIHQGINEATALNPGALNPIGVVGINSGAVPELKPALGQTIQPSLHLPGPLNEVDSPLYGEECQCVPATLCSFGDIVARHGPLDISELIDARSRGSDVLSNATDSEDEVVTTETPENYTTTQSSARLGKVLAQSNTTKEESRSKRDLLSSVHPHDSQNHEDLQERQFAGTFSGFSACGIDQVCCKNPINSHSRQRYACGQSNAAGLLGRVKNPHFENGDAEFGEYPWQAAILKYDNGDSVYVCGATLVSDRHLLTAAHCVNSLQPNLLSVRLGEWDVSTEGEFYRHVEIHVADVHIHPEYYAGNLQNDIALISLQNVVDFTSNPHISPVCLPDEYSNFVGQRCFATGWGKDAFGTGGKFQSVLKEVEVPVVSHHQCQTALRHTHLGANFKLHEGNICAGGERDRDTCKGDGGGPLVCPGANGNAHLVGLVSWGIGCGKVGIPGVYVNVAHYLDWIQTVLYQ